MNRSFWRKERVAALVILALAGAVLAVPLGYALAAMGQGEYQSFAYWRSDPSNWLGWSAMGAIFGFSVPLSLILLAKQS